MTSLLMKKEVLNDKHRSLKNVNMCYEETTILLIRLLLRNSFDIRLLRRYKNLDVFNITEIYSTYI